MRQVFITLLSIIFISFSGFSQGYWQQKVDYKMDVDLNVETNQISGTQVLVYTNNSPDYLNKVYYHLYFNAFQPGSMMDVRSRTISDPDRRVKDRISKLTPEEEGFQKIKYLKLNGKDVQFSIEGTVLTAHLDSEIAPGQSVTFEMEFVAQVPKQIRRSGRDNVEGIEYTMTQWYPKMAEYDRDGWHANEYVGREFYGVWGRFDVNITIDSNYVIGGTGIIQNPKEVGHGYSHTQANTARLKWHFIAENVHDFGWAADPDYQHDIIKVDDSLQLHFFYQTDTLAAQWKEIQPDVVRMFKITNKNFGRYPYSDFSIIQGGDGGMEYPMCTMILGHGSKKGKVELITHESIHNWYYGVLGTNEYRYPWMDEGMTTYAEEFAINEMDSLNGEGFLKYAYASYRYLATNSSFIEEPMTTPGDLFNYNKAYSISSYYKGSITQNMLRYIVGDEVYYRAILSYFDTWKFKHPSPNDLLRIMEQESDMELDWFFEHWVNTLHHIDYKVTVEEDVMGVKINLTNVGDFPMPVEVKVVFNDGRVKEYYIPLRQMRGAKNTTATPLENWAWVVPNYSFVLDVPLSDIKEVKLDPRNMVADIDLSNNIFPREIKSVDKASKEKKKKPRKKSKKSKK
jgi:hypothetical protein